MLSLWKKTIILSCSEYEMILFLTLAITPKLETWNQDVHSLDIKSLTWYWEGRHWHKFFFWLKYSTIEWKLHSGRMMIIHRHETRSHPWRNFAINSFKMRYNVGFYFAAEMHDVHHRIPTFRVSLWKLICAEFYDKHLGTLWAVDYRLNPYHKETAAMHNDVILLLVLKHSVMNINAIWVLWLMDFLHEVNSVYK